MYGLATVNIVPAIKDNEVTSTEPPEVEYKLVRYTVKWLGTWSAQFEHPVKVTFVGKRYVFIFL